MELREYQEKAKIDIYDGWRSYKHLMFQLVTGGGKTVIFVNVIRDVLKKGKRVILVAHREELIMQAHATLYKNKIIAGIIKGNLPTNFSLPCQVASIQTISRRKKLPHSHVVIFDEGHHCQVENSYGKVMEKFFSDSYSLSVTATPYRLSGHGFRDMFSKLILSKSYKDLVDDGYLTPYKYFISNLPDLHDIKMSNGDYNNEDSEKAMKLAPIVASYKEHCNGMVGIVFAVNVRHSKKIVNDFNNAGIKAAHIDADTAPGDRQFILSQFKKKAIKVISNVEIATEGFDFPDMEVVILSRPTMSLSLYLQMVGRPMRVNQAVISGLPTAELRKKAISESSKPFSYILDCAGCWENHGLPDQFIDWQRHFTGIDKRTKRSEEEMIEMIEYVAEDDQGFKIKSKDPKEIEGMKLIEVNKHVRKTVLRVSSIKKLDELIRTHTSIKNIKKKGFVTFFAFVDYCKKNDYLMTSEVWNYIKTKLNEEPGHEIAKAERYAAVTREGIEQQYGHNPDERDRLLRGLDDQTNNRIARFKPWRIPSGFIRTERKKYDAYLKQLQETKSKLS